MPDQLDLSKLERQARSAGHRDGLTELYAAGVFLAFSLSWLAGPEFVGIAAAAAVLIFPKLLARTKERVTYPRIGYSADRPGGSNTARGILLFIGATIAVLVGAVLISGDITDAADWRRVAPLLAGLAFTGGFWFTADRSGLLRYRAMAVASMATGLVLWAVGDGQNYDPVGYYLLAMGGFMLVAGVTALIRFMRLNPVLDGDEHP